RSMHVWLAGIVLCLSTVALAMESTPGADSAAVRTSAEVAGSDLGTSSHAPVTGRSGGKALAIGFGATVLPVVLGAMLDASVPDAQGSGAGLAAGVALGAGVGPAL